MGFGAGVVADVLLGIIGYNNASCTLSTIEIGPVMVLPPYQRTHVSSHIIGLAMQYALDLPKEGGLGVRRLQWQAHASNAGSIKAGKRMGLKVEGIIRCVQLLFLLLPFLVLLARLRFA